MFFVLLWLCSFFVPTYGHHCPPDALFVEATVKCYHFINRPFPFVQAEQYCVREAKGHLVSITNAYEMTAVEELATSAFPYVVETYWIGAKLIGHRPQWTNGNTFSYTNWKNGHPPHHLPNSCVQSSVAGGGWSQAKCENPNYFICESRAKHHHAHGPHWMGAAAHGTYGCESGWQHFPSTHSCYKVIHNKNWQGAEQSCLQQGAHLASIHSEAENDFIYRAAFVGNGRPCDGRQQVWIGLHVPHPGRAPHASNFFWTDGSPMDFSKWARGEPNDDRGTEKCANLYTDASNCGSHVDKQWNDVPCTLPMRAAVCKKPQIRVL